MERETVETETPAGYETWFTAGHYAGTPHRLHMRGVFGCRTQAEEFAHHLSTVVFPEARNICFIAISHAEVSNPANGYEASV